MHAFWVILACLAGTFTFGFLLAGLLSCADLDGLESTNREKGFRILIDAGRVCGPSFDPHRHSCRMEMGACGRNHIAVWLVSICFGDDQCAANPERVCNGCGAAGGILLRECAFATR